MSQAVATLVVFAPVFGLGYLCGYAHRAIVSRRRRLRALQRQGWPTL